MTTNRLCFTLAILAASCVASAQPGTKEQPTYVEIPIKGGFGEEINANGVFRALSEAKNRKIKHAVFVVDSPGGVVADAMAIEKVMDQFEGDITYHCVIVRGISASMAVVSGCRNVFMPQGGATGAAVSFSTNVDTGSAEVDAKMNAAWASQLAARADKHGQPGVLYRAMVEKPAQVWWGKDEGGRYKLESTNVGLTDPEHVDGPESVLALTVQQAVKYGFALPIATPDAKSVGTAISVYPWVPAADLGARAMKAGQAEVANKKADVLRDVEEFKKLDKEIDEQLSRYNSLVSNPTSLADVQAAGVALEKIKNNQRSMENLSRTFANKGKAWLRSRRLDENQFTQTLQVPQLTIDIKTEQQKLASILARYRGR